MLPIAVALAAGCGSDDRAGSGNVGYDSLEAWMRDSDRRVELLEQYCTECHNPLDFTGSVDFESLSLADVGHDAAIWEGAIRKLRAGLMPPQGNPRPERRQLDDMVQWLGAGLDLAWDESPNPGAEPVARLNRTEYRNAVRDLLAFDAQDLVESLPADATAQGFDNIAEFLNMSPTLLEGYLAVAMQISRQAIGDMSTQPTQVEYRVTDRNSQQGYVEGLPLGTRGGMVVEHVFPVDAEYRFNVAANIPVAGRDNDTGRMVWCGGPRIEVMFNGVAMPVDDPERFRLEVPAGPHTISLAMLDAGRCVGSGELLLGDANGAAGTIQGLEIDGPYNITGTGDTPSRRAIFVCRPELSTTEQTCARQILSRLATRAYRRPIAAADVEVDTLIQFYETARNAAGGHFDSGIAGALTWLLVDPKFLYRFEQEPEGLAVGDVYRISDLELASRLSFFIWSSIPDEPLLEMAAQGRLAEPGVLASEVQRMLVDPRAAALVENFVGQWLNLRKLDAVAPQDSAFDPALRKAMRQETLLFFESLIRENQNLLGLLDADYTYLNERLARHYNIEGVWGEYMRRVELPADSPRRGLLGQGSLLTTTSAANRTSPVVRGTWIVENMLAAHVPSPPPGVETNLEVTAPGRPAVADTLRQRMELHRANPECAACHQIMDPIGFSLENFDLIGRWRSLDNGVPIDAASTMVDGTVIDSPATLRGALLARPDAFKTSIAEHMLMYALGRELEPYDGPAVRRMIREATAGGFTMAALVEAVVMSDPFQERIKLQ
jgi:hypothetical protein